MVEELDRKSLRCCLLVLGEWGTKSVIMGEVSTGT